jgi:glucose-6-phosphate isomerase
MAITAARIGSSPITIDWSNLARISTGTQKTQPQGVAEQVLSRFRQSASPLFHSDGTAVQELQAIIQDVEKTVVNTRFTRCVFLGGGCSAVASRAAIASLSARRSDTLELHFLDSPDGPIWRETFSALDPKSTFVCVYFSPVNATETMAQLKTAIAWFGKESFSQRIIVIDETNDPEENVLRLAKQNSLVCLKSTIAGRTPATLLSGGGLIPLALSGFKANEILSGARLSQSYIQKASPEKNVLLTITQLLLLHAQTRPTHVFVPVSERVRPLTEWMSYLWTHALVRAPRPFFPYAAQGTAPGTGTLQLLLGGNDDKVAIFVTTDKTENEQIIPPKPANTEWEKFSNASLLSNRSLHDLLVLRFNAAAHAVAKANRPYLSFQLDLVDEKALGSFFCSIEAIACLLAIATEVDPFDQLPLKEQDRAITTIFRAEDETEPLDPSKVALERLRREQS